MQDRSAYPRVTTVLNVVAKDTLVNWAVKEALKKLQRLYAERLGSSEGPLPDLKDLCDEAKGAANEIKLNAARRGTATHHLIEGRTEEELTLQDGDLDSVRPMYESFKLWASERNFVPIANEVPIWSDKHGFKGTLDCIGTVDGRLELIDWKTSNHIGLDYRLQTAAYWYGLKECKPDMFYQPNGDADRLPLQGIRIVRFGGRSDKETQLKDVVTYDELIIDGEDDISVDFNAFLAAKRLHDWQLKRK